MKNILKFNLLLAFIFTISSINAQNFWSKKISGKGPIIEQKFDLKSFDAISMSVPAEMIITKSGSSNIQISGQENILENIELELVGQTLEIKFKYEVTKHEPIKIHLNVVDLNEISIAGSGSITSKDSFIAEDFGLSIAGSGEISMNISASRIEGSIAGSGDMYINGKTNDLLVEIAGSGDFDSYDLVTDDANVNIAGSGDCNITVNHTLDVSSVGSGDVSYIGAPEVSTSMIGSGKVMPK